MSVQLVRSIGRVPAGRNYFTLCCKLAAPRSGGGPEMVRLKRLTSLSAESPDVLSVTLWYSRSAKEMLASQNVNAMWGDKDTPGKPVKDLVTRMRTVGTLAGRKSSVSGFSVTHDGRRYTLHLGPATGVYFTSSHTVALLGFMSTTKSIVINRVPMYGFENKSSELLSLEAEEPREEDQLAMEVYAGRVLATLRPQDNDDRPPVRVNPETGERDKRATDTISVVALDGKTDELHMPRLTMPENPDWASIATLVNTELDSYEKFSLKSDGELSLTGLETHDAFRVKVKSVAKEAVTVNLKFSCNSYMGLPKTVTLDLSKGTAEAGAFYTTFTGKKTEITESAKKVLGRRAPLFLESSCVPLNATLITEEGRVRLVSLLGELTETEKVKGPAFPVVDAENRIGIYILDKRGDAFSHPSDLLVEGTFITEPKKPEWKDILK